MKTHVLSRKKQRTSTDFEDSRKSDGFKRLQRISEGIKRLQKTRRDSRPKFSPWECYSHEIIFRPWDRIIIKNFASHFMELHICRIAVKKVQFINTLISLLSHGFKVGKKCIFRFSIPLG